MVYSATLQIETVVLPGYLISSSLDLPLSVCAGYGFQDGNGR